VSAAAAPAPPDLLDRAYAACAQLARKVFDAIKSDLERRDR